MFFSILFRYKDKKSPDKLGKYPQEFHIKAFPERRYLWTSRILVILAVCSFCLNIMLTCVIYLMLPQKDAAPSFYVLNQEKNIIEKAQPAYRTAYFKDLLTEKYIADYIEMRHSVPKSSADLFYRWDTTSLFYWYSGTRNYYDFVNSIDNNTMKTFIRLGMKRLIEIDEIKKVTDSLWTAQFKTITTTKNMKDPDIIIWRAYMRIAYLDITGYENIEKDEYDKLNYTSNPFGFKVMSYSLTYAGKPEKSKDAMSVAKDVFENLEDVVK